MKNANTRPKSPGKRRSGLIPGLLIVVVLAGVPLTALTYQAHNAGLSVGQMFQHILKPARKGSTPPKLEQAGHGEKIDFLSPTPIGFPTTNFPRIGSVTIVDLDLDGLPDVLVCDMMANRIGWIRQSPVGTYTEKSGSPILPPLLPTIRHRRRS